jgi:hypothetical protein
MGGKDERHLRVWKAGVYSWIDQMDLIVRDEEIYYLGWPYGPGPGREPGGGPGGGP